MCLRKNMYDANNGTHCFIRTINGSFTAELHVYAMEKKILGRNGENFVASTFWIVG